VQTGQFGSGSSDVSQVRLIATSLDVSLVILSIVSLRSEHDFDFDLPPMSPSVTLTNHNLKESPLETTPRLHPSRAEEEG